MKKLCILIFSLFLVSAADAEQKCCHFNYSIISQTGPESTTTRSLEFSALPETTVSVALTPNPVLEEDQLTLYFTEESESVIQLTSNWKIEGDEHQQNVTLRVDEEKVLEERDKTIKIVVTKY